MNEHQKAAIEALENLKGNDLYRARSAFAGLSKKQLAEKYGESGQTRAEILREYEEREERIDAAIRWVKKAK
jgi:hypothetical protein